MCCGIEGTAQIALTEDFGLDLFEITALLPRSQERFGVQIPKPRDEKPKQIDLWANLIRSIAASYQGGETPNDPANSPISASRGVQGYNRGGKGKTILKPRPQPLFLASKVHEQSIHDGEEAQPDDTAHNNLLERK